MENNSRLLSALRILFYPLANLMLKNRIGVATVLHQFKLAFVEAALEKHGRGGKPATTNRIASLTGLSRPHVRDLLDEVSEDPCVDNIADPVESTVLAQWCNTDEYTDGLGLPKRLEPGPGPGTLRALINEVSPDRDCDTILRELVRMGSIKEGSDGSFELVDRTFFIPGDVPRIICTFMAPLASAIDKNLERPREHRFPMRVAHSTKVNPKKLPMIKRKSLEQLEVMLERLDNEMSRNEVTSDEPMTDVYGNEISSVGIGVFYFERDAR